MRERQRHRGGEAGFGGVHGKFKFARVLLENPAGDPETQAQPLGLFARNGHCEALSRLFIENGPVVAHVDRHPAVVAPHGDRECRRGGLRREKD